MSRPFFWTFFIGRSSAPLWLLALLVSIISHMMWFVKTFFSVPAEPFMEASLHRLAIRFIWSVFIVSHLAWYVKTFLTFFRFVHFAQTMWTVSVQCPSSLWTSPLYHQSHYLSNVFLKKWCTKRHMPSNEFFVHIAQLVEIYQIIWPGKFWYYHTMTIKQGFYSVKSSKFTFCEKSNLYRGILLTMGPTLGGHPGPSLSLSFTIFKNFSPTIHCFLNFQKSNSNPEFHRSNPLKSL